MTAIGADRYASVDDRPTAAVRPVRATPPDRASALARASDERIDDRREGGVVGSAAGSPAGGVVGGVAGGADSGGLVRLAMHLTLAGLPLLAISAHVFGLLPMHLAAALVVLPLTVATGLLVLFDPLAEERIVLRGAVWGAFATAVYDVFRLDTVYLLGWWGDFIPTMGTWVVGAGPDEVAVGAVAGYLWRYAGDGPGIGAVFFVLVAATGLRRLGRARLVGVAVAFAVFPVWAGLIATVGIAPGGQQQMFPLTATTVPLSLIGHLIFGVVLGLGCARAPDLERDWPYPVIDLVALVGGRSGPRAVAPAPGLPRARPALRPAGVDRIPAPRGERAPRETVPPAWWDGFDVGRAASSVPPPRITELTMPVPPPRNPTPPGGFPAVPLGPRGRSLPPRP